MQGIETDTKVNKTFIKSNLNKSENSYKSPFSQEYYPETSSKFYMSPKLTQFERSINVCLEEYAKLNYLECTSSAFCWEQENALTVVMFIYSPVVGKFGILEEGHDLLRVTFKFDIKPSS